MVLGGVVVGGVYYYCFVVVEVRYVGYDVDYGVVFWV